MYVRPNFHTKAELKKALAAGHIIEVFQPGLGDVPTTGEVFLEGPHYPEPHTWYAKGIMKDGRLVKVY